MSEKNIKYMLDSHISKLDKIIEKKKKYVNIINNLGKKINIIKSNNTNLNSKLNEIEIQLIKKEQLLLIEIEQLNKKFEEYEKQIRTQIDRLNNIPELNDNYVDTTPTPGYSVVY